MRKLLLNKTIVGVLDTDDTEPIAIILMNRRYRKREIVRMKNGTRRKHRLRVTLRRITAKEKL